MDQNFHSKQEMQQLFELRDAVQIFFVGEDGTVSTFSERSTLRIFRLGGAQAQAAEISAFIQVGDWTYPLIQGASPVLEAANGAFMFPDAYAQEKHGTAVGLVLAEGVPAEVRAQLRKLLDDLIKLKSEAQLPQEQQLGTVGKALVSTAESVNQGLAYASERAIKYIEAESQRQQAKSAAAQEDAKVSPYMKTTVKGVGMATKATAMASGMVADAVGQVARHTADYIAKRIDKPGSTTQMGKTRTTLIDAARGGLIAYGTVYSGLEDNAKTLGGCMHNNTVKVVGHKYGGEAGKLSGDAMAAGGDGVQTYFNVTGLGVKGFAKSTAKYAVQGVLVKDGSAHGAPAAPPSAQLSGTVPVVVPVAQSSVMPPAPPAGAPPAVPVAVAVAHPVAAPRPPPPSYDTAVKH